MQTKEEIETRYNQIVGSFGTQEARLAIIQIELLMDIRAQLVKMVELGIIYNKPIKTVNNKIKQLV